MSSVRKGEEARFAFGDNWAKFLQKVDESRIRSAEASLKEMLGLEDLTGKRFLDIGSGSGLFSLAARNLGATVVSFDYDEQSVKCTRALREQHYGKDENWTVERGSVLDERYMSHLGQFDVVYAWGVLHHTGDMWGALSNAARAVERDGCFYVALYNDQGWRSRYWLGVKKLYNRTPPLQWLLIAIYAPYLVGARYVVRWLTGRGKLDRGMSMWHDMLDWLGGIPFEVAKPGETCEFFYERGFILARLRTVGGRHGCNEFLLRKIDGKLLGSCSF